MPSNMKREYAAQPKGGNLNRSQFNLSRRHLTSFDGGYLVPIFHGWLFPGDVIQGRYRAFVRASSPLEFPLFDNLKLTIHSYFCPIRIIWSNFRKFMGEQDDPGDSIDYTIPSLGSSTAIATDGGLSGSLVSLMRFLGVPIQTAAQGGVDLNDISALPFRSYCSIYNWHYRDQNQVDSLEITLGDGPDYPTNTDYALQKRGKRHDYFTSLLSSPLKGDEIPAPAIISSPLSVGSSPGIYDEVAGNYKRIDSDGTHIDISSTTSTEANSLHAHLQIADLRNAVAIQQFLERDNRYGTRFDEVLYSHYGTEFNDVRIAPLYLGGGSGYITTTTIPNNSATTGELGDLAAIATGTLDGAGFTYACDEPGIYMAIANVSADISYSQGIHHGMSQVWTRYDMFWPEFTGIGDEAVEMKELYYQNDANDETVMGYNPRYEWLRTEPNRVSGEFDPNDANTLSVMHLQEDLGSQPVLGQTWVEDATPYDRMLRVSTQDQFLADFYMDCKIARALPVNGVPGLGRL
jgi:hypothetical protein